MPTNTQSLTVRRYWFSIFPLSVLHLHTVLIFTPPINLYLFLPFHPLPFFPSSYPSYSLPFLAFPSLLIPFPFLNSLHFTSPQLTYISSQSLYFLQPHHALSRSVTIILWGSSLHIRFVRHLYEISMPTCTFSFSILLYCTLVSCQFYKTEIAGIITSLLTG